MALSRSNGRSANVLRDVVIQPHFSAYAEGSLSDLYRQY